jgi:hypothetical protein
VTRFRLPARRLMAVAAGLLIGATGALTVSAPAAATDTDPYNITVEGTAVCAPKGVWTIDWKVVNDHPSKTARLVWVGDERPPYEEGKTVGDIHRGAELEGGASVSGVEEVEAGLASAKLVVTAHYSDGDKVIERQAFDEVPLASTSTCAPTCVETATTARYKHTFDARAGVATVELKGDKPLCAGEKQAFSLASYFTTSSSFAYPQYLHDAKTKWITPNDNKIKLRVDVPRCYRQLDLVFGEEVYEELVEGGPLYGDRKLGSPGAPGNTSEGPPAWFNGGHKECVAPAADFVSECDGSVTVHLTNPSKVPSTAVFTVSGVEGTTSVEAGESATVTVPASYQGEIVVTEKNRKKPVGTYTWERPVDACAAPTAEFASTCDYLLLKLVNPEGNAPIVATVSYAGETGTVTVPAGDEGIGAEFPPADGDLVVTFEGYDEVFKGTYTKPADCDAGGGGGGGPLPVTGPQAGALAGGAALILAAGGALFLMARRRRIRFTAV